MSAQTALLFLNASTAKLNSHLRAALRLASAHSSDHIYVHFYSYNQGGGNIHCRPPVASLISCSSQFYASASTLVPSLDVTVLQRYQNGSNDLKRTVELLLIEGGLAAHVRDSLRDHYRLSSDIQVLEYVTENGVEEKEVEESPAVECPEDTYDFCALGGTFDSIHNGHKVLLGTGIAMSNRSLTIGITDQSMNKKKTLRELIAPIELRKAAVRHYVEEVRADIQYNIVTLQDPYGPTITDENLQCLIVSEETQKGADLINEKRIEKGFPAMTACCIPLVADDNRSDHQEKKISSSSLREQRLGTLLLPTEPRDSLPHRPYLIGLTGGIASGKSSVGKRLESLGAGLVNSDLLAHEVYKRGCEAYEKVVDTFGKKILNPKTGEIERQSLGAIVFSDKSALDQLNAIVWPATAKLVEQRVSELYKEGSRVCFIEAALLLEAGWQSRLHEVWSCIIPEGEAVARLKDRNNLSEEEAIKRIHSQADNQYRVDRSNVVLCTLWDYSVTQKQVEKAWRLLQERLIATGGS